MFFKLRALFWLFYLGALFLLFHLGALFIFMESSFFLFFVSIFWVRIFVSWGAFGVGTEWLVAIRALFAALLLFLAVLWRVSLYKALDIPDAHSSCFLLSIQRTIWLLLGLFYWNT